MDDGTTTSVGQGTGPGTFPPTPPGFGAAPAPAEPVSETEEVIFLEPGQEQAQKFIRAISNQTANDLLQLLREAGSLRLSDIAERLGMSLNATKYHVGNLMDAGVLEISNTRYSVKGRKVKMYRMKNQIFIVAPSMTGKKQILSAVMKYGAFLGLYIVVALVILIAVPVPAMETTIPLVGALQPGTGAAAAVSPLPEFLVGCIIALILAAVITLLATIACMILVDWRRQRRSSSS
jgi:DNA-binding Lrp family transcriptional regulator